MTAQANDSATASGKGVAQVSKRFFSFRCALAKS
jgi:hypothetical protein